MSFDVIKNEYNSEMLFVVELVLDKCKFTQEEYLTYGAITVETAISASGTGEVLTISGGTPLKFTATSYILVDDEIIKVSIDSAVQITTLERGAFSTTSASHTIGTSAQIKHSGEVDGTCYDTPQTCSDVNSYDADSKLKLNFSSRTLGNGKQAFSGLKTVKFSDTIVDIGESLGKRGKATITINDSIDDTGSYDKQTLTYKNRVSTNGSRIGKQLARSVYFENRYLNIYSGFFVDGFDPANMQKKSYIIDTATLNTKENLSLTVLDPLILTEDKKSKAPLTSSGTLATTIIDSSTSLTLTSGTALDYAYGALNDVVYIRIDSEVIKCIVTGALSFDITERNYRQPVNVKKDHDAGSTVQETLAYEDVHVIDIITDLLTNYTTTPAVFIGDYSATKALIPSITLTAFISKPTGVKKLIDELIKHGDLIMYFDQVTQQIVIDYTPSQGETNIEFSEDKNIEQGSMNPKRNLAVQYTRAPVLWNTIDITKDSGNENFAQGLNIVNAGLEFPQGVGETNEKKDFYSRWLHSTVNDAQIGASMSDRSISRAERPPIDTTFNVDVSDTGIRSDGSNVKIGAILSVATSQIQNIDGSDKVDLYQLRSIQQMQNLKYQLNCRLYQLAADAGSFDFIINENKEDYDLSTEFAPVAGNYNILIKQGVTIGQVNALHSFTTGSQVAGVTFTIVNYGAVLSKGGNGGDAGIAIVPNHNDTPVSMDADGDAGSNGFDCFEITVPVTLYNGSGLIYAGGGGVYGGSSTADSLDPKPYVYAGDGGSGGRGYGLSIGGDAGRAEVEGSALDTGQVGDNGDVNSAGCVGSICGGDWGEDGDEKDGQAGGLSGYAIKTNGNTLTIISGDNQLNIKGRRS